MTKDKKRKKMIIYSGRALGRSYFLHEWFKAMIPTLEEGWTMGIPTEKGIALFRFEGIKNYSSATYNTIEEV